VTEHGSDRAVTWPVFIPLHSATWPRGSAAGPAPGRAGARLHAAEDLRPDRRGV